MKLNIKKVHQFVEKYQKELSSIKGYFSKCEQNSLNSSKTIVQMNEQIKKNIKSIATQKQTLRTVKQFAQNNQEKESSQKNVPFYQLKAEYIKFKINNWIEICEGILSTIKERMKMVDSKSQKKLLNNDQLLQFKKFLTEAIIKFEENKQAIVEHFATSQISQNCILLESLTNRMQRLGAG